MTYAQQRLRFDVTHGGPRPKIDRLRKQILRGVYPTVRPYPEQRVVIQRPFLPSAGANIPIFHRDF